MLIKKTKNMTDSERIAAENSNNQYLRTLTYAPVGMIVPYGGDTVPGAFLLCDGSALDTTEYADLFNVIGYIYGGSGDVFKIPNLSGATVSGISVKYIIKTANGITQQEVNDIVVNAVPKIAIDSNTGFMDAVICVKEGAMLNENGIPLDSDYLYKTIDTGSYAGKENTLPGGIAARDSRGNLWTGTPIDDEDSVNKKYVDNLAGVIHVMKESDSEVSLNSPAGDSYIQVNDKGDIVIHSENDVNFDGGRLMNICEPYDDADAANKRYVDQAVSDKISKPQIDGSPNTSAIVIHNQGGKIATIYIDDGSVAPKDDTSVAKNMIATRDSNGNLYTGEPVDNEDCVNKKYVDDLVGDIEAALDELHNYAQAIIGGAE